MKIVIWIVCIFGISLVMSAFESNGIHLGGLPTALIYIVGIGIARGLSSAWGNRKK